VREGFGDFNDGRSAAAHQVEVRLDANGLSITSDAAAISQHWPYAELRAIDPARANAPLRLTSRANPDARLRLSDPAFVEDLRNKAPHLFLTGLARANSRRDAGIILLTLLVLGLALWQGVPRLSAPLAQLIPLQWEQDLGLAFRDRLLAGAKTCHSVAGTAALSQLRERLTASLDAPPPLTVVVADRATVNAFALPGGHIIVLRGLLDKSQSADEVAAVLAHEIGHVRHRHPTQMAIRMAGIGMIADLLTGDSSALAEMAGQIGGILLLLSYNRDMERQADAYGRDLLQKAGLSGTALARFFARLATGSPTTEGGKLLGYLSSHPLLEERIAAADKDEAGGPALDAAAWRALQNICGHTNGP
jgi:Zn-dependent protease with chaperone function